jgi:hypothetical protein
MPKIKKITVFGTPNAEAKFLFKNAAGNTYDTATKTFTSGNNYITAIVGEKGVVTVPITMPVITSDDTYSLAVSPSSDVDIAKKLIEKEDLVMFKEYIQKVLTWTTSHTTGGYTIASALSTSFEGEANTYKEGSKLGTFELTGAISKSSALLYTTGQPDTTAETGGSFTNSNRATYTVDLVDPSDAAVLLTGDANIHDDMKLVLISGKNIEDTVTISKNGSNNITLRDFEEFPNIEVDQELTFSEGGWLVNIGTCSITGTGTTSLTATAQASVDRIGPANATITWRLQDSITTVPNAYDMAVQCSISAGTTNFSVQDGNGTPQIGEAGTCAYNDGVYSCTVQQDIDANKNSGKTYSVVAQSMGGKGTIGNDSTAFNNATFYTGSTVRDQMTFKYASGGVGDTCSFTYKANDGTTDSATKTVTITLIA